MLIFIENLLNDAGYHMIPATNSLKRFHIILLKIPNKYT